MIGISKLYCGTVEPSDALRYGRDSSKLPSHLLQFSKDKRPVVVWNVTRRCNLKCVHCYAHAKNIPFDNELTTEQGKELIDDLAAFGSPVMLFSGGEPLVRKDLPELAAYAVEKGMRAVISTNGTLITPKMARTLKEIGLSYVGISLDGMQEINDRFRGVEGAFRSALEGIKNSQDAGIKVGLRFTINKFNVNEIPKIFHLLEEMNIPRVCFYHLVYAGRGTDLVKEDLTHEGTRDAVDLIIADDPSGDLIRVDSVNDSEADTYNMAVPAGVSKMRVTLVWDDFEATLGAGKTLVNDLDLSLVPPGGTVTWLPWILDKDLPDDPATWGVNDLDNVEQVVAPAAQAGEWSIVISGNSVPQGPQKFSLVCNSAFVPRRKVYLPLALKDY